MITIEDVERERRALIEGTKSTPEERAAKLKERAQQIDELAAKCGPVIYGMYQHYNAVSTVTQSKIALFVALEAIGIICGRVWEGEEIVYEKPDGGLGIIPAPTTTDYLTILAKTGTGKETAKKELKLFLRGLGIPIAANTTGGSAIYYEAMKNPRLVIIQDEAGKHRQSAGSGKGDPYGPKAAETLLMDVYADRTGDILPTIIDIHAETEQYLADHPEARDLLTRKKQHTAQYVMRIALANSTFWQRPPSTEESTPEPTLKLTKKQKKENEALLKDAKEKVAAEIGKKKTPYKINKEEANRYEGVKSVYEIEQRAQADYFMRVAWRETLKAAEEDVKRLEKAVSELENKPSPTKEEITKLADLQKKLSAFVAREWEARTHYTAKTEAIEIATRRVYKTYPPVITKDIVVLAKEIINIAEESSLESLIESIPADKWYEAKEAVITILEPYGAEGLATSKLEKKLKKYDLKDTYAKLIAELRFEDRIEICNDSNKRRSPNGGFKLRIPQPPPQSRMDFPNFP